MSAAATMPATDLRLPLADPSVDRSIVILLVRLLVNAGRTTGAARRRESSSHRTANSEIACK